MCFIQINLLHLAFPLFFCLFVCFSEQTTSGNFFCVFVCVWLRVHACVFMSCKFFTILYCVACCCFCIGASQSHRVNLFKVFFIFFFFWCLAQSCQLLSLCYLSFSFLDSYPSFCSLYLSSLLPTFKLHLLFLRSLYASTFISTLIHKLSWLGLTLEITCRAYHSSCLILSSNVWNIFSFAFPSSSLPSFCVRANKKV